MLESRQQMMPSPSGRSDRLHNQVCSNCVMPTFPNALFYVHCTVLLIAAPVH